MAMEKPEADETKALSAPQTWSQSNERDSPKDEKDVGSDQSDSAAVVAEEEEDVTDYPGRGELALIVVALCLSVFCMALDNTIISTVIPRITDHFRAVWGPPSPFPSQQSPPGTSSMMNRQH